MGERRLNKIFYLLLRHVVVLLLLQVVMSSNHDLTIKDCKQEWVRVTSTAKYSFRVNCAFLGFESVPTGIPPLTAELLLNGNSIPSLDDQALAGLTSLHVLDLSGNDITTINETAFKDTKLERLDLSRNKIKCDTRIWWLVAYAKTLTNFSGMCLSPRPLRTTLITNLKEEDLAVDCLSVKQLRNASQDGEYNIRVFARDNSKTELCIYCHQMSSSRPKEFLTLPAGVHHNYVKMKVSNKCGYNDTDPALEQKLSRKNELTSYFIRVRILLSSLRIITTDTTFGSNRFLNFGQPGICGRKLCTTNGTAKIDLRGTHFHIKEDKKIITTRRCYEEKCNTCNVSNFISLSMMDHHKYPYLACTLPLGVQNGRIKNSSITATSYLPGTKPYHARLNSLKYHGWCAEPSDQGEYIKFDLGVVKTISGISTQGHRTQSNWVKTYHVFYSSKVSDNYQKYKEFGEDIILVGNEDSNTVATHWFQPRFRARFILVKPLTWNGNETNGNKICMRIELYGCANDITSYIIKPQLSNKCLTIDTSKKEEEESYPRMLTGCAGPDYMFTFQTNRLMHTQTGLCVNTRERTNELILTQKCSSSNIQFQKVRQKDGRDAFLIKDKNLKCARIYNNTESFHGNMQIHWVWCLKGGFSILFMTRKGVTSFSPNFADTPKRVTTDLFKQVTFQCRAHADPHVIFRWSKGSLNGPVFNSFANGQITEKTEYSILRFRNITWEDRGVYYCNAWNSKGNSYREYEIEVNAMQWFHRRPTDQKVIWGTTATFHCISRGIPNPVVKWVKYSNGRVKNITSDNKNTNNKRYVILENKSLVIKDVVYRDEGIYMCVSTSPKLVRNSSASLDVYVTQEFTTIPEAKHILFGEGTVFKCVSEGKPTPKVRWKMSLHGIGGLLDIKQSMEHRFEVLPDKSLHVKAVTFSDEGRFYCISESPGLVVNVSAELTVYVTQNFTTVPADQTLLYGHNATFECASIGVPPPQVSWVKIKGNYFQQLFTNHKYIITSNNTLRVINVVYEDEGEYACFSQSPRLRRNASAILDVYVTQNFTKSPNNTKVFYGYNATFECVSVGIPKPVVTWARKVGESYEELESDEKYIVRSESLTILTANYQDEMEYVCFSQSPLLRRNATATLDVYVTQKFDVEPKGSRVLYGNNYSLHCTSSGIPPPTITWKFKHIANEPSQIVSLSNSSKIMLLKNGTLALYDVSLEESGTYYCVSESPGFSTNVSAKVHVYVTQIFTKEPKSLKLIKGEEATFECASEGSPTPVISWKYIKTGQTRYGDMPSLADGRRKLLPGNTLIIKATENGDEGDYICLSKSPGLLVNRTATLIVHIKPVVRLSRSSKSLHLGQTTSVSCQVSGDPFPTITWYKMIKGEKTRLGNTTYETPYTKLFKRVKKENEGLYRCEAKNDVGVAQADYHLTVQVTCLLGWIENSRQPKKYRYEEKEKANVACKPGFRIDGISGLTCMHTGKFDYRLPICRDINECNETLADFSSSGDSESKNLLSEQSEDEEPEVCGYDAECKNTIGSYYCECNELYQKEKNKCEFARGITDASQRGGHSGSTRAPVTIPPPPQDTEKFFRTLNTSYESDEIAESVYLSRLQDFSSSIVRMQYDSWKLDGINKVLDSLEVAVKLSDRRQTFATAKSEKDAIRTFSTIVNDVLNDGFKKQWQEINQKSNGSVLMMKYLEHFILQKAKILTMQDFDTGPMEESFSNLDVKIVPVTKAYKNKALKITMQQKDNENVVNIPFENYDIFKDHAGVVIMYKTLHELFPKPSLEPLKRAKIQSRLFTLSFMREGREKLIKPIQITFKMKEKVPVKRFCSYWDFKKPYGGGWSTTGCEPLNISSASEVICECTHLSNFAIIVPKKTAHKVAYLTFTLSVAVGITACIILAFCTCMSHVCCTSYTHGDRQAIMTNITIVIILGLMVFAGGVFVSSMELITDEYSTYFCFSLIGIIQLLAVACFGWLFSESIHILFSTRPVIEKRSSNLFLFYILGWVVPVGLLAITGVLVYLDKFQLQSRCSLKVSFYLIGILVGAPSACYIIATVVLYMLICVSTSKNSEILGSMKVSHARRSLLCSGFLIIFHLALLGAVTLYLHFNGDAMFHHILGGVAASEGIYLIIYHMFLDRMAARSKISGSPRSRQRNSYSTKETITYASNGNAGGGNVINDDSNPTEQTRFLIKTSSKRSSVDNAKPTPPQLRTPEESSTTNTMEWDSSHGGGDMYGDHSSPGDMELKPVLAKHMSEELPETIYEEEKDFSIDTGLETFGQPNVERNGTLPRSYSSLPRKKQVTRDFDEISADGSFRPTKRPPGKSSSIVSIETHTSTSSQQGLPVYFPSAPPHHEIFFEEKKKTESTISTKSEDDIDGVECPVDTSRPASFGIDSDRMSNLSSELSNILYELQAFNTERHPSESLQTNIYNSDSNANTLPHPTHRNAEGVPPDLSRGMSTFKPSRAYAKTEVQFDNANPPAIEHHRVRVLRGRSRADADPSDGLHGNSDSIYSSL